MICSGEQTVAFYFLDTDDLGWINSVNECLKRDSTGILQLSEKGIAFTPSDVMNSQHALQIKSDKEWNYQEQIGHKNTLYIVGGGHVGLALSEIMNRLGFFVVQLDDREELRIRQQYPVVGFYPK